ncbi:uncharacterized protein LOC115216394 [Argonauta hians]
MASSSETQEAPEHLDVKKCIKSPPEIVLGLETEDGACALVEIDDIIDDTALAPEVITGNVRRSSITEKLNKSRESEAKVAEMKVDAEQRQRDFEQLLDEHAELVQNISRSSSSESVNQRERD